MRLISETGIIRGTDKAICDKCNADLSVEGGVTFCAHFDGPKAYGYEYTCNRCGNHISQVFARDEASAMLWGDDDAYN